LAMMVIAAMVGTCVAGEAAASGARASKTRWQNNAIHHNTEQKGIFMTCLY